MNRNAFAHNRLVNNHHGHNNGNYQPANFLHQNGNVNGHWTNRRRRTVSSGEVENGNQKNKGKMQNGIKSHIKEDILKNKSVDRVNSRLNQYRKDSKFCDFELHVGEKIFPVHKLILAASSDYFEAMFSNFSESSEKTTQIGGEIDPQTFEMLLNYIYTGDIKINSLNVQEVARISHMFQLMELVEYCSDFLESSLSIINCIGILRFAEFYNFQNLYFVAKHYVEHNFCEVCKEEEFLDLPVGLVRSFLRSENLSINSEYQVLYSTMKWIMKDECERLKYLDEFINLIRMPLITLIQLKQLYNECTDVSIKKALTTYIQAYSDSAVRSQTDESLDYGLIRLQPRMCQRRRIYVLGGLELHYCDRKSPKPLHTMVKFSLHSATWKNELPFVYPRRAPCVVLLNGKIYLIGGEYDSLVLDTVEIFNPEHEFEVDGGSSGVLWAKGANLQLPRSAFGACVHSGKIYAFGGKGNRACQTIEQYDPELGRWNVYDRMPKPLHAMQVVEHNGLIYIIGGRDERNATVQEVCSYNPCTRQFKWLESMKMARSEFACTVLHGNIYVIGGLDERGEPTTTVEQYNIAEDVWTYKAPLQMRRAGMCAISLNNRIYIFGGRQKQTNFPRGLKDVDVYVPEEDHWYPSIPMPSNRSEAAVVLI